MPPFEYLFSAPRDDARRGTRDSLKRRSWWNWVLLTTVSVIAVIGLITAMNPLVRNRLESVWPWAGTDVVLLIGMSILMLAFTGYLTLQQKVVSSLTTDLEFAVESQRDDLKRHYTRLLALFNITQAINQETELRAIFDAITSVCAESFSAHRVSLMILDPSDNSLVVRSLSGLSTDAGIINRRVSVGRGVSGWVAQHREAILLADGMKTEKYPDLKLEDPSITASMVVPIILRGQLVGVLNVSAMSPNVTYDHKDLQTLQVFAEQVGTCIRHAEHVQWLRSMIDTQRKKAESTKV